MTSLGHPSPLRAAALTATLSLTTAAVARALLPRLSLDAHAFDADLVALATVALLLALGWACVIALAVLVEAATGRSTLARTCPAAWRPLVLGLCGAALVAGAPAYADQHPLPPLDVPAGRVPQRTSAQLVVHRGDSLWAIEHTRHPAAGPPQLVRRTAALYRANRRVIGADPDLIRPGQRLEVR